MRRFSDVFACSPSRAETGCLLYTPHRDLGLADTGARLYPPPPRLGRPERFVFFERWASRAALAEHERTKHFEELVRELTPLLAQPLDATVLAGLRDDLA